MRGDVGLGIWACTFAYLCALCVVFCFACSDGGGALCFMLCSSPSGLGVSGLSSCAALVLTLVLELVPLAVVRLSGA